MNKKQQSFEAKNIVTGYEKKVIIDGIDLSIPSNKISVIIGSNGCGKSTLLKTLARLIKPVSGDIIIDGKKITTIPSKKLAQVLGLLPQSPVVPEGITVWDLVSRGRFPYQAFFKGMNKEDFEAVEEALEIMGITELANRSVDELSGGQRQRVWIAMALAQQTDILLLDEPFSALDNHLKSSMENELIEILKDYQGSIVYVTHDIGECYRICDDIVVFNRGLAMNKREKSQLFNNPMTLTEANITGCKNISEIDIINEEKVFAKNWGIECILPSKVMRGARYIGIRSHHIRLVENDLQFKRENLFELTVTKVFENSFSYIVYVQNLDEENTNPIQIEVEKNISPIKVGEKVFVKFETNCIFDFC